MLGKGGGATPQIVSTAMFLCHLSPLVVVMDLISGSASSHARTALNAVRPKRTVSGKGEKKAKKVLCLLSPGALQTPMPGK